MRQSAETISRHPDLPVVEQALFSADRPHYAVELERRNALVRALTPEYAHINPDDYTDITFGMVEYVQPDKLQPHLIDVPRPKHDEDQPCVVSYYAGRALGEIYLAVTPEEAKKLPRNVGAIRRAAQITTASTVTTPFPTDQDRAREERSGRHVHEQKLEILQKFLHNKYEPEANLLDKFIEASQGRNFGLARFGDEGNMRSAMATLRTQIFGDMIHAYARQRQLNQTQTRDVERTITTSIYLDRQNNQHLRNFGQLVRFAKTYNLHKQEAVKQRIEAIERSLG